MRDFQKSKVYKWEDAIIKNKGRTLRFDQLQGIVDGIWLMEGWLYPPKVRPISKRVKKHLALGSRGSLYFQETVDEWLLLHEVAHALAGTQDETDRHGPVFVGLYMKLLAKYLKIPELYLYTTAMAAGVQYNPNAKPMFLDKQS